jgi:hypothetical protein
MRKGALVHSLPSFFLSEQMQALGLQMASLAGSGSVGGLHLHAKTGFWAGGPQCKCL